MAEVRLARIVTPVVRVGRSTIWWGGVVVATIVLCCGGARVSCEAWIVVGVGGGAVMSVVLCRCTRRCWLGVGCCGGSAAVVGVIVVVSRWGSGACF